jgi:hypothetical protein
VQDVPRRDDLAFLPSGIKDARPQNIGTGTGLHHTPELGQRLLEVVAEAKGRASWKRIADLPELAEFHPAALKQRWQFLVYEARNAHWQQLRASLGLVDDEEVDVDAFDGMAPDEVPFDEDEDEEFGADVLAGDDEEDEGAHAQERSSNDEPPRSPSAKRAYNMFAAAHEQDPELAQMPDVARAKKIAQMWHVYGTPGRKSGSAGSVCETFRTSEEGAR